MDFAAFMETIQSDRLLLLRSHFFLGVFTDVIDTPREAKVDFCCSYGSVTPPSPFPVICTISACSDLSLSVVNVHSMAID